ncbi:MAG: hypothetical protein WBJ10_12460, partial [Daejeonella sp.]|uniref:hypothetical protein n=1 Tax=Daejeonella sp. TaxID=2805397 RepID=UPI003C72884B
LRRIVDEIPDCSEFDVFQMVLEPVIQSNPNNYSGLFSCYDLLARCGKKHSYKGYFDYHKLSFRYLLLRNIRGLKNSGSTGFYVEILGRPDTCSKCKHLEGKVYKSEDILEEMPIPNEDCTRDSMCCSTFLVMTERRFLRSTEDRSTDYRP